MIQPKKSAALKRRWASMSLEEKKAKMSSMGKIKWDRMSDEERKNHISLMTYASVQAKKKLKEDYEKMMKDNFEM